MERLRDCVSCGFKANADLNAAMNILSKAGGARFPRVEASGLPCR